MSPADSSSSHLPRMLTPETVAADHLSWDILDFDTLLTQRLRSSRAVIPLRPPLVARIPLMFARSRSVVLLITAVMAQGVPSLSRYHRISAPPIHIVKYNVCNIMETHVFCYPAIFFCDALATNSDRAPLICASALKPLIKTRGALNWKE